MKGSNLADSLYRGVLPLMLSYSMRCSKSTKKKKVEVCQTSKGDLTSEVGDRHPRAYLKNH